MASMVSSFPGSQTPGHNAEVCACVPFLDGKVFAQTDKQVQGWGVVGDCLILPLAEQ